MIYLSIDTSVINKVTVALEIQGVRFEKMSDSGRLRSQMVLPLIESLLQEHTKKLSDLDEIFVVTGPGSFTGVRIGVAVANALAFLLHIPVNGKETLADPIYS